MTPKFYQINFHWKMRRPKDPAIAQNLKDCAHKTAMEVDPATTQVLLREDIHETTKKDGQYVKDDPHITVSLKNPQHVKDKTHHSAHGYTKSVKDHGFVKATSDNNVKPDTDKMVWPEGLDEEDEYYPVKK
ncbi:MAG: hypothetical protein Q9193_001249 [Seirophora villosa]